MNNRNLAFSLILLGGILGLLPGCISFLSLPFMADPLGPEYTVVWGYARLMERYGMIGYPNLGLDLQSIMVVWSLMSLAGGCLASYAGLRAFRGCTGTGKVVASSGGVLLLLTFSWIPALTVMAGCLMLTLYKA